MRVSGNGGFVLTQSAQFYFWGQKRVGMRTCDISNTGSQLDTVICRGMMVVAVQCVHLVTDAADSGVRVIHILSYFGIGKRGTGR